MKSEQDEEIRRAFAIFSTLGFSMAGCIIGGFFLGRFLDGLFGSAPWLTVILAFLGSGAAIKMIFDVSKRWR
jgi:F0F1-type ATP synthase assembly protein I